MKNCFFGVLLLTFFAGGCNFKANSSVPNNAGIGGKDPIEAVATVGMVAELVRNVGGEHVSVTQICGSGVDPHGYLPTRDDVQDIMDAEIVFYCGLMLEGKMIATLETMGRKKPVVAVTDAIDHDKILSGIQGGDPSGSQTGGGKAGAVSGDTAAHGDPHVWNDVSMWSQCIDAVRDALSERRPQHAEYFAANAKAYQEKLAALHQYGIEVIGSIPEQSRLLVTSHDAFSYFGRAYQLDVRGIQGISTESEAGLRQINGLVDLLIQRNVKAVFVESSVSPKNVDALIEGAASKGHKVAKGGMLFSDAMGAEGTYEGTYIGMLDHNLTTASRALGGKADEGGFQGKLSTQVEH